MSSLLRSSCRVLPLLVLLIGCASNPANPDGSVDGMDGRVTGRDGSVGPTGRCGRAGGSCCVGRVCELGLSCGAGDLCCIQAGGGAACDAASDCCRGLACQGRSCCAPRGAACTGSADCCSGLACSDGACVNPDEDLPPDVSGCGGAGSTCCPGFTCRSGLVCNEGTCGACGDDGQPCCDGTTSCLGSLACDVTTATCVNADPATACGEIDRPCCAPPGGGPATECAGDRVCVGGTCLNPEDTGFEGAPCGSRGTCDPDLVCDRRMDPSGLCAMTPADCGRDGMGCCDLGGSEGECAGELHCQFGSCTTCRGPSLTCLLGGLLPGQECCAGSVCRPAPLVPRCCMGEGGDCENSLDCCGLMSCGGDGTCSCSREGSFCLDSSECCDGFTCQTFMCRPEGPACLDSGAACSGSSTCCAGLACSETRSEPTAPPVRQCCSGGSTSCDDDEDCCGRMACEDGECECVVMGGLCDRDIECCDGETSDNICVAGACANGDGCARETQTCSSDGVSAPMCCGGLRCDQPVVDRDRRCCAGVGNRCRNDMDCCGNSTCGDDETCQCVVEGSSCETGLECCAGLSCMESSPGSGSFSCTRPPG
ncbi:MAG: hypothetical protein RLO52_24855 [Sandaracinaceae bacterium]